LGFPNAGKSTLITSISAARPKIADYPFTTLYPNLGVVKLGPGRSFVMADIPGLVEGAAEGAGLGIQFLKHLSRTSLLLHIIDINPMDASDPAANFKAIEHECAKYSDELAHKESWLVLNKIDTLLPEEVEAKRKDIVQKLNWKGPVYSVCALSGEGTKQLCEDILRHTTESKPNVLDSGTNEQ